MAFMDKALFGVKKMNWMGLAQQLDPPLTEAAFSKSIFFFFPAKRHRTFGTLFRSKSQQNWIFGKSKARNFAHVFFCSALLVFVFQLFFLEDYGPSKPHLEQNG